MIAEQEQDVLDVLMRRVLDVGSIALHEGTDFGVTSRATALGGQQISLQGISAQYADIFLPLHGAHQAHNAAYALAAVEAFTGSKQLDDELVREAFAQVTSPGRLEVVRRSPTVLLDAAHNPHGARATVEAVQDAFTFSPLIGVVGVMADKDVEEMLRIFEPVMAEIVCTQNSTPRSMSATGPRRGRRGHLRRRARHRRRPARRRARARRARWPTRPRAMTMRSAAVACSSPAR